MEDDLELYTWANVITSVLTRERWRQKRDGIHDKASTIAGFQNGRGHRSRNALEASKSWKLEENEFSPKSPVRTIVLHFSSFQISDLSKILNLLQQQ